MTNTDMANLINELRTARIYAGAEFEKLCNEKNMEEALIFQNMRDALQAQIEVVERYKEFKKNKNKQSILHYVLHQSGCR